MNPLEKPQIVNLYLVLKTEAYLTVPARKVYDDAGTVIGSETLHDIFPDTNKYPLSDLVMCGVEITDGSEIPAVTEEAIKLGFTVGYGYAATEDVRIVGHAPAQLINKELSTFEASHYLDQNGVVQPNPIVG